jgi:formylglycine-generating enzyme required for sulfatase activity
MERGLGRAVWKQFQLGRELDARESAQRGTQASDPTCLRRRAARDQLRRRSLCGFGEPRSIGIIGSVRGKRARAQTQEQFQECDRCPTMVVVPAGESVMGSREDEQGRTEYEGPRHRVAIAAPFAVSKFEVTFEQWDTCYALGGCRFNPDDVGWGRGNQPVINVNWSDAEEYVHWLSSQTGKEYRLLSETEWEYAARAGSDTAYSWGNEIHGGRSNCNGCGSKWDGVQPAPVGSFPPNSFGVYDINGNVSEWVEDCWNDSYEGAPSDGSAWTSGACSNRVVRGGSWGTNPQSARAAARGSSATGVRNQNLGFRIARTLGP